MTAPRQIEPDCDILVKKQIHVRSKIGAQGETVSKLCQGYKRLWTETQMGLSGGNHRVRFRCINGTC